MSYPVYYVEEDDTLPILFDTFDGGTGASITMTGLAVTDIEIYKDGSVTQRASDAGFTLLDTDGIDFDGVTGIHGFSLDLSDDTDSGFYAVGSWYHVVVSTITVDSQTVSFVACAFRIVSATRGLAGTALPDAAADAAGGLPISDAGGLDLDAMNTNISDIETDTADMQPKLGTITDLGGGATIGANLVDIEGQTDDIGAAGAGLTAVPWNSAWDTEVQSEVDDALVAQGLDHLLAAAVAGTDIVDNSIVAQLVSASATADWDDFDNTTDSLQATRDHIGDGTNLSEAGGDGDHLTEAGGTGDQLTAITAVTNLLNAADSEPAGVPAANETPLVKLAYLFMMARNQIDVTATKKTYYDDGGSAEFEKDLSDDGTTYSESEANAI